MTAVFGHIAPHHADVAFAAATVRSATDFPGQLHAVEVIPQDDIDYPGDGVGPVGCRSAVLENIHAFDRGEGDIVDIDKGRVDIFRERADRDASAVDQNKGGVGAEAAQGYAGAAIGGVVAAVGLGGEGTLAGDGQLAE